MAALLCGASGLRAQDAAQGGAPPKDDFKFSSDRVMILWTVKTPNAADFESAWSTIKSKLVASDKPDLKELGTSINMVKLGGPAGGAQTLYLFDLNPVSKTLSYNPTAILYAPGFMERTEADAVYKKITDSVEGINPFPMVTKVGE